MRVGIGAPGQMFIELELIIAIGLREGILRDIEIIACRKLAEHLAQLIIISGLFEPFEKIINRLQMRQVHSIHLAPGF